MRRALGRGGGHFPTKRRLENGRDLVSLYVMLGIGLVIMLYVRFTGTSDYFSLPRETYEPDDALQPSNPRG